MKFLFFESNCENLPRTYEYLRALRSYVDELVPKHLNTQIWRMMLESSAAEQAARMSAKNCCRGQALSAMKQLLKTAATEYKKYQQKTLSEAEKNYLESLKVLENISKKKE